MVKINFQNNITKCNADTFNTLQDNIEDAIPTLDSAVSTSSTNGVENQAITNYVDNKLTYSTSETQIGYWIDGKPLYRKIYTFPALKNNDTSELQIDSTYKIVNFDVIVKSSTDSLLYKLPFVSSTSTNLIGVYLYIAENKISVRTFGNRTNYNDNYAIVEYTKTTD